MSTYSRIQALCTTISQEKTKQQEKRASAKQLVELLGNFENRRRLAVEATPDTGSTSNLRAARHKALSEAWKLIIQVTISYVESTLDSKKVKINRDDIGFPVKLIKLCHTYDVEIDYTEQSKDFVPPRLSRKLTKSVIKFYLDLLDDDDALNVAENELLDFLDFMCSRREFVSQMNPIPDMQTVLEEVEGRVLFNPEYPVGHAQRTKASLVFQSLIETAIDLGVGLHLLLPGCVKMVSKWITRQLREQSLQTAVEFVPLMNGIQLLIRRHPDLAIAPLKRHGKIIFAAAKRRFDGSNSNLERRVLNSFFKSYLIVSQMAGALSGKKDGDVGSLGQASMQLGDMISILRVIFDNPGRVLQHALRSDGAESVAEQEQFELVARLLVCSQRLFLVQNAWQEDEDVPKLLQTQIEGLAEPLNSRGQPGSEASLLVNYTPDLLLQSPLVTLVLRDLALPADSVSMDLTKLHPVAGHIFAISNAPTSSPQRVAFLLKVLTAVTEFSPTGACWVMTAKTDWLDVDNTDFSFDSNDAVQLCRPTDLALIVHTVQSILLVAGGPDGNQQVQDAALTCLAQLVSSTMLIRSVACNGQMSWRALEESWRCVWNTLVSPDLRYCVYTKDNSLGSLGYLVMTCLVGIERAHCTDLSTPSGAQPYTFARQSEIWSLHIFQRPDLASSTVVFELVSSILLNSGLSESGTDMISCVGSAASPSSRRHRLVSFCLCTVHGVMREDMLETVSCCLALLVNGDYSNTDITRLESNKLTTLSWKSATGIPTMYDTTLYYSSALHCPFLVTLWERTSLRHVDAELRQLSGLQYNDSATRTTIKLWSMLNKKLRGRVKSKQLPRSESRALLEHCTSYLRKNLGGSPTDKLILTQVILSIEIVKSSDERSRSIQRVAEDISEALDYCQRTLVKANGRASERLVQDVTGLISTVVSAVSLTQTVCPTTVARSGRALFEKCRTFLEMYTVGELASRQDRNHDSKGDSLFEDDVDGDDSPPSDSRKRGVTSSSCESSRKRSRLVEGEKIVGPSLHQAFLLAGLMLTIDPSQSVCEFVTSKLLAVSSADSSDGACVDGGVHALLLLARDSCFAHYNAARLLLPSEATDVNSAASSLSLIFTTIKAIRFHSSASSRFHLFGYRYVAQVLRKLESIVPTIALSNEDLEGIKELLCNASNAACRSVSARPLLRVEQLVSVIVALRVGGQLVRSDFSPFFPRLFVVPSLSDIDFDVRSVAPSAIQVAMEILPEENVVQAVWRLLPDFFGGGMGSDLVYREWCKEKNLGNDEKQTMECQTWEDAKASVHWHVLRCLSTMGGVSRSQKTARKICLRILQCAHVSYILEPLCQKALDSLAQLKGFASDEAFLESALESLSGEWLKMVDGDPLNMPCILSAPRLLRHLVEIDAIQVGLDAGLQDMNSLKRIAASEYVSKRCMTYLPQVLQLFAVRTLEESVTKEVRRSLLEDEGVRRICSVFYDCFDDSIVTRVLRAYIGDIFAFSAVLRLRKETVAAEIERLLAVLFPSKLLEQLRKSNAVHTVTRMLYLSYTLCDTFNESKLSVLPLVTDYLSKLGGTKSKDSLSIIGDMGGTVQDFALAARLWLSQTSSPFGMGNCWTVFETLACLLLETATEENSYIQLIMLATNVSSLLLRKSYQSIHPRILDTTAKLTSKIVTVALVPKTTRQALSSFCRDTIAIVFHVHETAQLAIARKAESVQIQREWSLRKSLGLREEVIGEQRRVRDFSHVMSNPSADDSLHLQLLKESHQVLQLFLANSTKLRLEPTCFVGLLPPYRIGEVIQSELSEADPLFCIQKRIGEHDALEMESLGESTFQTFGKGTAEASHKSLRWSVDQFDPVNERILLVELGSLEVYLRKIRGERIAHHRLNIIGQRLSAYCTSNYSDRVQIAATKCLGAISGFCMVDAEFARAPVDGLQRSIVDGSLTSFLRAKILSLLSMHISSRDEQVSLVAKETLVAVSRVTALEDYAPYMEKTYMEKLRPLLSCGGNREAHHDLIALRALDLNRLHQGHSDGSGEDWCFNAKAWKEGSCASWEDWVTTIVPGLLVHRYPTKLSKSSRADGSDFFLGVFQRISSLAPLLAEALFPLLLLDLMGYAGDHLQMKSSRKHIVPLDAESKDFLRLQECINTFLDASLEKDGIGRREHCAFRGTELVVGTLDLIRRLIQESFLKSEAHRSNPATTGGSGEKQAKGDPPHKSCLLGINWLKMAGACIQVRRFAAALFYLEFHADAYLGGSNRAFKAKNDAVSSSDISYVVEAYGRALGALGELEDKIAIDWCAAELGFFDVARDRDHAAIRIPGPSNLVQLRASDCDATSKRSKSEMSLLKELEVAGLEHTMNLTIAGVATMSKEVEIDEYNKLRDHWFESCVNDLNWSDAFLEDTFEKAEIIERLEGNSAPGMLGPQSRREGTLEGFNECVAKTIAALLLEDTLLARSRLSSARLALASTIPLLVTNEASITTCNLPVDKLEALDDLDIALGSKGSFVYNVTRCLAPTFSKDVEPLSISRLSAPSIDGSSYQRTIRETLFRVAHALADSAEDKRLARTCLFSELWMNCRETQQHVSERALQRLYRLLRVAGASALDADGASVNICRLRLQEAIILEGKGDFSGAIRHAKETIRQLERVKQNPASTSLLADAFVLCGTWMAENKVEPATHALDSYLRKGSMESKKIHDQENTVEATRLAATAYLAQAQVLSALFETVSSRTRSLEWEKAGRTLADRRSELESCSQLIAQKTPRGKKAMSSMTDEIKSLRLYQHQLAKSVEMAQAERIRIEESVEKYRKQALKSTVSALILASPGEGQVSRFVYRMIHLWFTCEDDCASSDDLAEIVDAAVRRVPSFRFVTVASQLFSRVELRQSTKFQMFLHSLLERLCQDHPYHCLVQLLSLSNGKNVGSGVSGRNAKAFLENTREEKVEGAHQLLSRLRKEKTLGDLLDSYTALAHAYVHLAMFPTATLLKQKTKNFQFSIASKASADRLDQCLGIGSRRRSYCPCILTKPPPIRPGCDYDENGDIVGTERVKEFDPVFAITDSGLHRPKIVVCVGTKGGRHKQLVKGEDEIRQDAVMEQVFEFVNSLMKQNVEDSKSRRNPLKLVTYNIVPLSPASGVLEWVDKTVAFGEYMVDRRKKVSGHSRHCPGEWSNEVCRQKLRAAGKESAKGKRKAFDQICENHSAVFRQFFVERFGHVLQEWHAARMRYTRSVAINSIVGHILGIGDRHGSNILVHQGTGEVVHIDFGIVFEQGRLLTTPELVPFRLTQNIVDGFGPVGVDGTFLSASKQTLGILRKNSNALMTILSAIKSDPLYSWSISPVKATARQQNSESNDNVHMGGNDEDENMAAAHSIRRIQEKLQGYEDGTAGEQQSVEGQVQLLISSAQDRDNLCQMFPGWQPWT